MLLNFSTRACVPPVMTVRWLRLPRRRPLLLAAIDFATASPLTIPPEAIRSTWRTRFCFQDSQRSRYSQFIKPALYSVRDSCFQFAKIVPPAADVNGRNSPGPSTLACSRAIPNPTSFTITGTETALTIAAILFRQPRKSLSPSGINYSWGAFK